MKKLIAFLIILASCTATRNNHAVVRVLSNNTLTEKVGRVWEKSNPCVIDTAISKDSIETIRYDTLINTVSTRDTVYNDTTLVATITQTFYKTITKTIAKTYTITITKNDLRRLNLQIKDNMALQAQINQLQAKLTTTEKSLTRFKIYFFGLIGVIVLLILLKFYFKI